MATNISTIGATARDYATVALWESATQSGPGSGDIEIGEMYADATFTEAGTVIAGASSTSSAYRILRAASGQGHDGTSTGSGVTMSPTFSGHCIEVNEDYAQVGKGIRLFLNATYAVNSDECVRIGTGGNTGVLIDGVFGYTDETGNQCDGLYWGNWAVGTASDPLKIQNCVFHGFHRAGIHLQNYSGAVSQYAEITCCTILDCNYGIGYAINNASATMVVDFSNNLIGDCTTACTGLTGSLTGTRTFTGRHCFDEDNTSWGISDGGLQITITASVAPGVGDWAILDTLYSNPILVDDADNDVLGQGEGPGETGSITPTYDILGTSRGSGTTCDPGAYQVSSLGFALAPDAASGTGAAYAPSVTRVGPTMAPSAAPAAGGAFDVGFGLGLTLSPAEAVGGGTAYDPGLSLAFALFPGEASGSGAAYDPGLALSLALTPGEAVGAGAAYDASVTLGITLAPGEAAGAGVAYDPGLALTGPVLRPATVAGVGAAYDASFVIGITLAPSEAAGAGVAYDPGLTLTGPVLRPATVAGVGVAYDASIVNGLNPDNAVGQAFAYDVSLQQSGPLAPEAAIGVGVAYPVTLNYTAIQATGRAETTTPFWGRGQLTRAGFGRLELTAPYWGRGQNNGR